MAAKKARKRAAKKTAAKKTAAPFRAVAPGDPTPAAATAPKGPERRLTADGKRPHDPITYADAIALGLLPANVLDDGSDDDTDG